ncbi:MAG: hypothetical protein GXP29_01445, partial [Planctomycetes bacterium]|nr:hypothetical protein [Planctomycetota bacterium]
MVTTVVALAACVSVLVSPELFAAASRLQAFGREQFLWTAPALAAFEGVVLFIAGLIPFALLGLLIRCAHQVSFADGRWHFVMFGWFFFGAALGFGLLAGFG